MYVENFYVDLVIMLLIVTAVFVAGYAVGTMKTTSIHDFEIEPGTPIGLSVDQVARFRARDSI